MTKPAYLIIAIDVNDEEVFGTYGEKVGPMLASYGAEVIVANSDFDVLEGSMPRKRMAVIKFPSMDQAKAFWYAPEYQPLAELRKSVADQDIVLVEGL